MTTTKSKVITSVQMASAILKIENVWSDRIVRTCRKLHPDENYNADPTSVEDISNVKNIIELSARLRRTNVGKRIHHLVCYQSNDLYAALYVKTANNSWSMQYDVL